MKRISLLTLAVLMMLLCACHKPAEPEPLPRTIQLMKEEMRYTSDGLPYYKNTYTYDSSGRMLTRDHILYPVDGLMENDYTETFSYNDHGHLISFVTTEEHELSVYYTYTYNDDGSVASYSVSNDPDGSGMKYNLDYDDAGRFLRLYTMDESGNQEDRYSCTYDSAGRVTKIAGATFEYDNQGRMVKCFGAGWIEYQYDDEKIISENRTTDLMHWTYSYSDGVLNGIVLESGVDAKYGEFAARSYSLNEHGKIVKVQYDNGGWIEYTYEERTGSDELKYTYWNVLNEPLGIREAYHDIMAYVLPSAREHLQ